MPTQLLSLASHVPRGLDSPCPNGDRLQVVGRGGERAIAGVVVLLVQRGELVLQLRNLQTMVEIGVDKNSMIMFPAPLMSTIGELGAFLSREAAAASREASGPPVAHTPALTEAHHPNGAPLPA